MKPPLTLRQEELVLVCSHLLSIICGFILPNLVCGPVDWGGSNRGWAPFLQGPKNSHSLEWDCIGQTVVPGTVALMDYPLFLSIKWRGCGTLDSFIVVTCVGPGGRTPFNQTLLADPKNRPWMFWSRRTPSRPLRMTLKSDVFHFKSNLSSMQPYWGVHILYQITLFWGGGGNSVIVFWNSFFLSYFPSEVASVKQLRCCSLYRPWQLSS